MNRLALVRAGYGLLQLGSLPLSRGTDAPAVRRTVRVLGLRQLVQAAVTAPTPSPAVLALGVEVDLLHAASMVALAAVRPRYRRAALAEALAATALACAGTIAARRARSASRATPTHRLVTLRDRYAGTVVRYAVPVALVRRGRDPIRVG